MDNEWAMMKARLFIYRGTSHSKIGVAGCFFTEVIFAFAERVPKNKKTAIKTIPTATKPIQRALAQADRGAMLARKAATVKLATSYELKTKLVRYGLSRGYDYEVVLDAASSLVKETDSCDEF